MPVDPQAYRPERALLTLGETMYDVVEPARFPQAVVRFRNDRAAAEIGLDRLDDDEWIAAFARFVPLPDTLPQPLALRYHGHQFGTYNPELGDGRGFSFAQARAGDGRLLELGTKGSGTTPWSRFGDGRLTLKGAVREVLASEMLEALSVPTSRSLSVIETGEALVRGDEPSPTRSAVLVRMSHGHVRIGSFQRLAYERDEAGLRALTGYALATLFGETPDDDAPLRLFALVVARTATLAARYMAAGFVHGVLNTDNINVTGESFDYGPWRFAPTWDAGFVAAYFDQGGRYAFGRQPEAIRWDAMQLGVALSGIAEGQALAALLDGFAPAYRDAIRAALLWRMGVASAGAEADRALVQATERALSATRVPLDRFFYDVFGGTLPATYDGSWDEVRELLSDHAPRRSRDALDATGGPCSILIDEVEATWSAIAADDDWTPFHAKIADVRALGAALA